MRDINKTQGIIISIIFLISILGGWFVSNVYSVSKAQEEDALSMQSQVVAATLDRPTLSKLSASNQDLNTDEYLSVKRALERARATSAKSRFVYVLFKKGDMYYFAVDAEPTSSEDFSPPGQEYTEAPEAVDWSYRLAQTFVSGPNTDRWGTWLSAYSPVINDKNKVIAVVGVDADANAYLWIVWLTTLFALGAVLVPLISVIFLLKIYLDERSLGELRNEFMALAAHELRSPMTAISWTANSMLAGHTLDPLDAQKMRTIVIVTKTLIGNITSILSLVKLEKMGMSARQFEHVNFSEIVRTAVRDMQESLADQKGTTCVPNIAENISVSGVATLLTYTCTSLLSNAIKYSPEKSVVEVSLREVDGLAQFCVSDRGIGIPEEERKKIFAGFYRATNAQKSGATGSGFGLYIIQRVVVLHGGTITCKAREGGGSVFCVTLPIDYKTK